MQTTDSLALRIMLCRKRMGLSQAALAGLCGVHSVTVSAWERGVKEPRRHFHQLAAALDVSEEYLTTGFEPEPVGELPARQLSEYDDALGKLRQHFMDEAASAFTAVEELFGWIKDNIPKAKPTRESRRAFRQHFDQIEALFNLMGQCHLAVTTLDPYIMDDFEPREKWPGQIQGAKEHLQTIRRQRIEILAGLSSIPGKAGGRGAAQRGAIEPPAIR